jgi:hypothetical protein
MTPGPAGKPPESTTVDHQQQIRHFQSINSANVTNTVNILLTLSVGLTAFGVNIIVNAKTPLESGARNWLVIGLLFLFSATLTAIAILYTRIEDYRRTIVGAKLMRDNPGLVTDRGVIDRVVKVKRGADRLNRATNVLLYILPACFLIGFLCMSGAVLAQHWTALLPAAK